MRTAVFLAILRINKMRWSAAFN